MNSEENQGFTSFDFVTILVSFIVIAAVTGPIVRKNIQSDQSVERARVGVRTLGRALIDPNNLPKMVSDNGYIPRVDRSVASIMPENEATRLDLDSIKKYLAVKKWEGDFGKDPWGKPYHFAFLRNAKGTATHVAVCSFGPNQIDDTKVSQDSLAGQDPTSFQAKGDDQCSLTPLR